MLLARGLSSGRRPAVQWKNSTPPCVFMSMTPHTPVLVASGPEEVCWLQVHRGCGQCVARSHGLVGMYLVWRGSA